MSVHVWRDMFNRLHDVVLFHAPFNSCRQRRQIKRGEMAAASRAATENWGSAAAARSAPLVYPVRHPWSESA